jgi:prepilin-type N-terminal cleavage/methylation domain-containing protein
LVFRWFGSASSAESSRAGFTILELLTVMVIIVLLMSIAAAGYLGMRRGAEMRSAVSTLRTAMMLARQQAVTHRRDTIMVFRQTGTNTTYYVFEEGGTVSWGSAETFTDMTALWRTNEHAGRMICKIQDGVMGTVSNNTATQVRLVFPGLEGGGTWQSGDRYGWLVHPDWSLPPGIVFRTLPDSVRFVPSGGASGGTAGPGVDTITLKEFSATQPGAHGQVVDITLYRLTGLSQAAPPRLE